MKTSLNGSGADCVAQVLVKSRDDLASRVAEAVLGEVEAYARLRETGLEDEIRKHCLEHIDTIQVLLALGRGLLPGEIDFTADMAKRRARQLLPIDDLMHAYRIGARVIWDLLIEESLKLDDPMPAVLAITETIFEYTDVVSSAAALAFSEERGQGDRERDRLRRDLVETLLHGSLINESTEHALLVVGLPKDAEFVVLSAVPKNGDTVLEPFTRILEGRVASAGGIVAIRHGEIVGIVRVTTDDIRGFVTELLETPEGVPRVTCGVSFVASSMLDVPRCYGESTRARSRTARGTIGFSQDEDLFTHLLSRADANSARLVGPSVRELAQADEEKGGDYGLTLRAFLNSNLDASRAASLMHVHSNTVRHRLLKVKDLTGLDPRNVRNLNEILLALRVLELERGKAAETI